jgi:hypothetical protein
LPRPKTTLCYGPPNITKIVSVYGGIAPEGLEELQDQIEKTANVTQFVESPDFHRYGALAWACLLRFMSDDDSYGQQFPQHPLSKVRRTLATLAKHAECDF